MNKRSQQDYRNGGEKKAGAGIENEEKGGKKQRGAMGDVR